MKDANPSTALLESSETLVPLLKVVVVEYNCRTADILEEYGESAIQE
jgi:hypothetical protein